MALPWARSGLTAAKKKTTETTVVKKSYLVNRIPPNNPIGLTERRNFLKKSGGFLFLYRCCSMNWVVLLNMWER